MMMLTGCQSGLWKENISTKNKEQLYVDAKLNFAIKHPLEWKRVTLPVSSPEFKADRVRWTFNNLSEKNAGVGNMLIQSFPRDKYSDLQDLLCRFLADRPELKSGQAETFIHPSGSAIMLLGHDMNRGRLTVALKGQLRDFIIALDCPSEKFNELLPVFQDIIDSFTEVIRPGSDSVPVSK